MPERYPEIRDLQLLLALAQRKHFTRAAADCGISQPAFSARIHHLEEQLGIPIVRRGNKFLGFTNEGELALKWARRVVADAEGMRQELEQAKGGLKGVLTIGVVPTALPYAASLSTALRARHEKLVVSIQSLSSIQIARALQDVTIDAGITYEESAVGSELCFDKLYLERYVLLTPAHLAPRASGTATWAEAASLPLCLLSKDMRYRQIVDEVFDLAGFQPQPVMESNAFTAAVVQVNNGAAATIAPQKLVDSLFLNQNSVCLELIEPRVEKTIGLATLNVEPSLPAIEALRGVIASGFK